jgi:formylglycine-generating enzyme required for sulfatase activity
MVGLLCEKAARGDSKDKRPEEISERPKPYWFEGNEDDLKNVARFKDNSDGHIWPVDDKLSDSPDYSPPWSLSGLCGNVWEWCMDEQGFKYTTGDREYPDAFERISEEDVITNRMIRGGSYNSPAWNCRHAVRHYTFPTVRADTIGFRLCAD